MGNSISITTDETKADPYAWKNVLGLPLVGSSADVSNQINSGSTTKAVTANGNAAASSDKSNFYDGSFEFDGTDDRLTLDIGAGGLGSGDFTIEFWSNSDTTSGQRGQFQLSPTSGGLLSSATNALGVYQNGTGFYRMYVDNGGSADSTAPNDSNKWNHFAVVRSGSTQKMYVNGIESLSASSSIDYTTARYLCIGGYFSTTYLWDGYIQDFRIYKGVAKYTSNFIPASTDPDILPDTPSGVSGSSKLTKITDGAVSFDGSGDYLTLASSSDFTFGTNNYTIECFVYYNATSSGYVYDFRSGDGQAPALAISNGTLFAGGAGNNMTVSNVITTGKWYHIALVRNSNTETIYIDGVSYNTQSNANNLAQTGLSIGNRFAATFYYHNGFVSNLRVINGTALYTSNFTPSSAPLTNVTNTKLLCCQSNTSAGAAAVVGLNDGRIWSDASQTNFLPGTFSNAFDDNASSYAETTATDAIGSITFDPVIPISSITTFKVSSAANGNNSQNWGFNGGSMTARVCNGVTDLSDLLPGSGNLTSFEVQKTGSGVAAVNEIEINGVRLINGGGSLTVNGNATATNFNPFNTDINTVRGQETGYATLNPLDSATTLSDGNLTITGSGTAFKGVRSTIGFSSGKWYMECILRDYSSPTSSAPGIWNDSSSNLNTGAGSYANAYLFVTDYSSNYRIYTNAGSSNPYSETGSLSDGDLIGIALDLDNGKCYVHINGIYLNGGASVYDTWPADTYFFGGYEYTSGNILDFNFGQKPFKFPPPEGFQPLNTANVRPETVIARPDQYVGIVTYTGNGAARSITTGFKPDLVWVKKRGSTSDRNVITDSVRGANLTLNSDDARSEASATEAGQITAFNGNGFSLGTNSNVTGNGDTFVAWAWKAGGNSNTFNVDDVGYASASAAGLDSGSITPTGASVSTKSGFSIVTYTAPSSGAWTVGHGLNAAPEFIITKSRSNTYNWGTYHVDVGNTGRLDLNSTGAVTTTQNSAWNNTSPTSTVFSMGSDWAGSSITYVAYCWHDVPGLQKFGSYSGNGSATDGTFVELGFKPAVVIIKNYIGYTENWLIFDNQRNKFNIVDNYLHPNTSGTEDNQFYDMDFLSNGFKLYNNAAAANSSGNSAKYIYAAWAEAPSINLFGGGANAR